MDRQIERHTYILMYRQINKKVHRQMDRLKAGKHVASQLEGQVGKLKDILIDRQSEKICSWTKRWKDRKFPLLNRLSREQSKSKNDYKVFL